MVFLCLTACSTATVHRRGGDHIEGVITGGDATSIRVIPSTPVNDPPPASEGATPASTEQAVLEVVIPRDDITRIQHPGTATTVFGLIILAAGTSIALLPAFLNDTGYDPLIVTGGVVVAGGGLYVIIAALITRTASYDAAKPPLAGDTWLTPVFVNGSWGVGLGTLF